MAVGVDNFDSYSTGDLHGGSGGSGWSGNWDGSVDFDVTTTNPQQGANAVTIASSINDRRINRTFTGVSTGIQSFRMRIAGTNGFGDCGHNDGANTNAAQRTAVRFNASGNIIRFNDAYASTDIQAYSANTYYKVEIDFDTSTDDYRVRVDEGTWTARGNFVNTTSTTLDRVDMHKTDTAGSDWFFDNIEDTGTVATRNTRPLLTLGVGT